MRIWYQGLSSPQRKPVFYRLLNEYARKVGAPGTEVEFHGLITGGLGDHYRSIEMLDTRPLLENALKAERDGFDAFAIGNTLDAGLYEARELVNIPVLGILETALLVTSMMGRNFALIAPGPKFIPKWEEMVARYGFKNRLACITSMEYTPQGLEPILDPDYRQKFMDVFMKAARPALDAGAEVLIPVGGAVVMFMGHYQVREIENVPVFDSIAAVIKMTEVMVKLRQITGTFISRKLKYAQPPKEMLQQVLKAYQISL